MAIKRSRRRRIQTQVLEDVMNEKRQWKKPVITQAYRECPRCHQDVPVLLGGRLKPHGSPEPCQPPVPGIVTDPEKSQLIDGR